MPPPEESPPRNRNALPSRIGRYRILDRVGRGAMGVVYAAHDDAMGRPVAVKVLMGDLESDPETRARFYREAQAAAGLLHPNIITIYDAGEDQGRSYMAMQLLEGWPLSAYLKQPDAVPVERKLDLMVQICEGLAAAHARGIVHRDLKPGNLFVQSDGLLKILDFGVARLADSSMTATGAMLGTPDYMSPEQARGTQVDTRSDIFSTGAVFYFMLAGRKPFPGPDLPAVLRQLQFEQPAPLREVDAPPELARLVMHAMAKDPSDRPPRVQELLAGIVRFRRVYQAETRKLVAEAGARYTALATAVGELRQSAATLDLPVEDEEPAALRSLRERFPALSERGSTGFDGMAFDRARVTQVLSDLNTGQPALVAEATRRRRAVQMIEDGEQALAGGDARGALRLFEQVRIDYPSSRRAGDLVARSTGQAREQEVRDQRVAEITAAARTALDAREWTQAIEQCEAALAIVAAQPAASAMLLEAQQGIAREQRRRALLVQQSLDRAAGAIEEGRFDEANLALTEAEGLEPFSSAARELRDDLVQAMAIAADSERVRVQTADEIRRARAAFRRGRYDEAVADLRGFVKAHAGATVAAAEAARLGELRDRIAHHAQERRRQVAGLIQAARSSAARGAFDDALASARQAVRHDPSDPAASAALDDLLERDLQERIERERMRARELRSADVEPMMAVAREARGRGYLAVALDAALGAQRIAPDRPDVLRYVDELRRAAAEDDAELFDLVDEPFAPPRPDPPPVRPPTPPSTDDRPSEGGVLSHVNQWAADLLRRRAPNR